MSYVDAVCSECQRLITRGARYSKVQGDYVMEQHPAANVNVNVLSPAWKLDFDPSVHYVCKGSGDCPERIVV